MPDWSTHVSYSFLLLGHLIPSVASASYFHCRDGCHFFFRAHFKIKRLYWPEGNLVDRERRVLTSPMRKASPRNITAAVNDILSDKPLYNCEVP